MFLGHLAGKSGTLKADYNHEEHEADEEAKLIPGGD